MKKIFLGIFVLAVTWGCVRDNLQSTDNYANSDFTVEEAKEFFENHMASTQATRSTSDKNGLIPGDFTVEWSNVKQSSHQINSNLEFAINGSYAFRIIRSEFENGRAKAYIVPAYQKLLVVKNPGRNRLSNYIMTIIPDRNYSERHKNFDPQQFTIYGDHTDFSGLVIYSTIENRSWPIQVTVFRSGQKTEDYSFFKFGVDGAEKLKSMIQTLKGIKVYGKRLSAATRSGGEDFWDDLMDELNQEMEDAYDDMLDILDPTISGGNIDDVVVDGVRDDDGPIEGADGMTNDEWVDSIQPGDYEEPDESHPYLNDDIDTPTSPDEDKNEIKTTEHKSIKITGTDEEREHIQILLDKIATSNIGSNLLDKISSLKIAVTCVDEIPGYKNAEGLAHKDGTIDMTRGANGVMFEELFHQYQYNSLPTDQSRGNREFEAKCADAIAVSQGLYMGTQPEVWSVFSDYVNNQSLENLNSAIESLRGMGYSEKQYPINTDGDMLPHLNNINDKK